MKNKKKISVILCCLNEIERLPKSYDLIVSELSKEKIQYEIIVIDNGSTDGTIDFLSKIENRENTSVILNKKNLGKGGSIRKAINFSNSEYVLIFDPDMEYDPKNIIVALSEAEKTGSDFILGSRLLNQKPRVKYYLNYVGVIFLAALTNLLYGSKLTDTATALKLIKKDFLDKLILERNSFNLDFELVCRSLRAGGKINEIHASYYPRTVAQGKKIKLLKDGYEAILTTVQDRFIPLEKIIK